MKLIDDGVTLILKSCESKKYSNRYVDSSFTNKSYKDMSHLKKLKVLDSCGAHNLSHVWILLIDKCRKLVSLNLTWFFHVIDVVFKALAQNSLSLEFPKWNCTTFSNLKLWVEKLDWKNVFSHRIGMAERTLSMYMKYNLEHNL